MFWCIDDVLDADALSSARDLIDQLDFVDGRSTAGWHARGVKHNLQAKASAELRTLQASIVKAVEKHALIQSIALIKSTAPPLVNKHGEGQSYGLHVDDAYMRGAGLRSDLSLTLFLSDPGDYEGGELVIDTAAGEDAVKLNAGCAVLYPSGALHRVADVTSGERIAAVTWIQSLVRDAGAREILFDIDCARRAVFERDGKCRAFDLLSKSYSNLLRRWADV